MLVTLDNVVVESFVKLELPVTRLVFVFANLCFIVIFLFFWSSVLVFFRYFVFNMPVFLNLCVQR